MIHTPQRNKLKSYLAQHLCGDHTHRNKWIDLFVDGAYGDGRGALGGWHSYQDAHNLIHYIFQVMNENDNEFAEFSLLNNYDYRKISRLSGIDTIRIRRVCDLAAVLDSGVVWV